VSISAAEVALVSTNTFVGELFQIHDSNGEPVRLTEIAGVHTGANQTLSGDITAIDVSTKTITVATDPATWTSAASPGDSIIVHPDGLADPKHAGTYTILSTTTSSITVAEELGGEEDEVAVTVDITVANTGDVFRGGGADFKIVNEDRGLFRWIDGGAMVANGTSVTVIYWQYAIVGKREFLPQSSDTVEGSMRLIMSRDNFGRETERYIPKCKVTPGAFNATVDAYSNFVLNFEVVSDDTLTNPVGHVQHYKGSVPSSS
jgi:hypothetical protein